MDEYQGIKRGQCKDVFYWLDEYCHNKDPKVLDNDIVLQDKVKKYQRKKFIKIMSFNIGIWSLLIYFANELTKG